MTLTLALTLSSSGPKKKGQHYCSLGLLPWHKCIGAVLMDANGSANSQSASDGSSCTYLTPHQQAVALSKPRLKELGLPSKSPSRTINAMALLWQFWLHQDVRTVWKDPFKAYIRIGTLAAMITAAGRPSGPCPFLWLDCSKLPADAQRLNHAAVCLLSKVPFFTLGTLVMQSFFAKEDVTLPQGATWPEDHPIFNAQVGRFALSLHQLCKHEEGEAREHATRSYAKLVAAFNSIDCERELMLWDQQQQRHPKGKASTAAPAAAGAAPGPEQGDPDEAGGHEASPLRHDDTEHAFHLQECVSALAAHQAQQIAEGSAAESVQERKRLLRLYADYAIKQRDAALQALDELEQLEQAEPEPRRRKRTLYQRVSANDANEQSGQDEQSGRDDADDDQLDSSLFDAYGD